MNPGHVATTREALHAVCEHVLAAALYAETGRIGLRVVPGAFATPPFGSNERVVMLGADHVTVTDRSGTRSGPLTTLRAAGALVGIEPGAPASVYTPATRLDPDAELTVDAEVASVLIHWYETVSAALTAFASSASQTLWPEHLDIAIRLNDCNYGGLAGDAAIAEPYAYVGPPSVPAGDAFFDRPFGAARTWTQAPSVEHITALFTEGARRSAEWGSSFA